MPESTSTRRRFLAVAGGTLLAGCSGLDQFSDSSSESFQSHRLPDVTDDGDAEPVVVDTIPLDIERARLAEVTQCVTDLLGTLLIPFGPEDIQNGYVRAQLVSAAINASDNVDDARSAQSRLSALQSLREARSQARYAAAGWSFADDGTTREAMQADHQEAVSEAHAVQADHEYLGVDPVAAMLVHARIERNLGYVFTDRDPSTRWGPGSLLAVAEWGEHAESARALVTGSRYLYDQFISSLPADDGSIAGILSTAAESLSADLQRRKGNLPAEPTENDQESLWRLRYDLYDAAESTAERVVEMDREANVVFSATEGLTNFLAYNRIEERIEGGEQFRAESASDVREVRSQAIEAIQSALEQSSRPELARPVLADAATTVAVADDALARARGEVQPTQLNDPIRRYTTAQVRVDNVPTACERVLEALDT